MNVGWTPDSRSVVHQVQNREQTWLDLNLADARSAEQCGRLLRETTPAWVNENGNPIWLRDGSFLWFSEQSGFKHLYHSTADGRQRRPVTRRPMGRAHASTASTKRSGTVYFAAGARDHLSTDVYRIASTAAA